MKKILIIMIMILPLANALEITMIYPNPYTEAGSEFIQLYNPSNTSIHVEGWSIATPTSSTDATLTGTIDAHTYYLVTDSGWDDSKDNSSWPAANHQETLTMPNTDGYVQILDEEGNIVDTVGYGNTDVFEEEATGTPEEGKALIKVDDTQNNAEDFISGIPAFSITSSSNEAETTNISIDVTNEPPTIVNITITDDDEAEGIQLIPIPGGERMIEIEVTVHDPNGLVNVTVAANGLPLELQNTTRYTGSIPINISTEEIHIRVEDEETITDRIIPVDLLAVVGISIPTEISLTMQPGTNITTTLDVENTGTTNVSIQIKGTQPTYEENNIGPITYTLQGTNFPLQEEFREHAVALIPGAHTEIALHIEGQETAAGTYVGQIFVAGVTA